MKQKKIDLIGIPMDLGAGVRGVDMGPSALRIAKIVQNLQSLNHDVVDKGDVQIPHRVKQKNDDPQLRYLDAIEKASDLLGREVYKSLSENRLPICLGGDHSLAIGSLAGASKYCHENNLKLGVIWIDAHADMNTNSSTPSGNIHGMPLSASLGHGHDRLTNILGFSPKIKPENTYLIGVRSIDQKEQHIIKSSGIRVYSMTDIDKNGIYQTITEIYDELENSVDRIHVSFDVDSVDPEVAPGVGTPEKGGLSYREAHLIMEKLSESEKILSYDVVEVNPILDEHNKTAEVAVDFTNSLFGKKII